VIVPTRRCDTLRIAGRSRPNPVRPADHPRLGAAMRLFVSLQGYRPEWLSRDVLAGLTVWAVLVPEALAYATIAGVSPVVGLYAAPAALLLYAIFGSSRHLVTGPMAATAALSAAAVGSVAAGQNDQVPVLTIAVALTVGVIALAAGLLRLGFLAGFISEPVLKGFIVGLAMTLIVGQLPKLFGVPKVEGDFFQQLAGLVGNLGQTNGPTLVVGLVSLVIVVGLREVAPVIPGSLIAVGFGIAAVSALGLDAHGVDIVGPIQSGLPAFGLPHVAAQSYLALGPSCVGIALVAFAEGLGAAKTYATRDHYDIDTNRELIGLGIANLGAGLSSGMVVNGSLSKTAVNGGAGAKSQLSGLVVAALTIVTLLFLTGLFANLPEATLSAIVIAALIELVDIRSLVGFYRLYTSRLGRIYGAAARPDFIAAAAALLGVLIFDTLPGLFIGIAVSGILLVYRASRPHVAVLGRIPGATDQFGDVERHPENVVVPGVAILRPEGGLFFANADRIRDAIRAAASEPGVRAVVVDLGTVHDVDLTAAGMVKDVNDDLKREGKTLVLAHEIGQVRDIMRIQDSGAPIYPSIQQALAGLESGVDGTAQPAGSVPGSTPQPTITRPG
jgi:high affinity sulfate transporter 1